MQNVFPSLAFRKKRLLWKLRGYMTGQRGRQRAATKHGLSGCHVDYQGLFHPENKPYLSSLPLPYSTISGNRALIFIHQGFSKRYEYEK